MRPACQRWAGIGACAVRVAGGAHVGELSMVADSARWTGFEYKEGMQEAESTRSIVPGGGVKARGAPPSWAGARR